MATCTYTKQKKDKILKLVTLGWPLKEIALKNQDLPCAITLGRWLKSKPAFRKEYELAKKDRDDVDKDVVLDFVFSQISEGVTVTKILKEHKDLPRYCKLMRWIYDDADIKEKYLAARELFAMKLMDDALDLSEEPIDFSVGKQEAYANINLRRLKIDTMKFTVAKAIPQIINLQGKVEHSGISVNIANYSTGENIKAVRALDNQQGSIIDQVEES